MKSMLPLALSLLIAACASNQNGRVVHSTSDVNGGLKAVELSEYYESKVLLNNGSVLAHLIVTLGEERLPNGYESPLSWSDRSNDRIDAVQEIYLTNNTDKDVTLEELSISYYGSFKSLIDKNITISAKSYVKSNKIITTTSIYRAAKNRTLKYKINNSVGEVTLIEKRMPVKAL